VKAKITLAPVINLYRIWRRVAARLKSLPMSGIHGTKSIKSAAALIILTLSGFSAPRCGAAVYNSDGSEASVQACIRSAADGDIVTVPAGTFSWTSRLEITKGITLQGATTIKGAGTSNPTITDATIIKDDTPRSGSGRGIINVTLNSRQSFRLTGITFSPGSSTTFATIDGAIHLVSRDSSPNTSMRIDHCHFAQLYQGKLIWVSGWIYGVADHNVIECRGSSFPFNIQHDSYGGTSQRNGNGSWADYPWYGTGKFWFIEDNTIIRLAARVNSLVDSVRGGRWVARHNYLRNAIPSGHGTEGGVHRGQRVNEFYNNTVHMTTNWNGGSQRSGTSLWHDNTFTGVEPTGGRHCALANYRETPARAYPVWGIGDGTSPWDLNDTDGNGHSVEGQPPFLFDSGAATSDGAVGTRTAELIDNTKTWIPNQWVGYSVKSTDPQDDDYTLGSYIISNTSNTITYYYYSAADTRGHLVFKAGDQYKIHRVLTMMDQNGRGKGDLVTGNSPSINRTAGKRSWPHQALEPCYSWNNVHSPSNHIYGYGVSVGQPTTKLGTDYFNLGGGFPADTTPAAVSSTYTAALNGVDYVGPFVYPHPLVTGAPTPTPSATLRSQQHLQKKKGKKAEKAKKKKTRPKKLRE
jgi:hypothetical protein